ncbi:YlcG family protein [Escherichia albertii]|nr:YlcG family protein [Escherichia albertii]
MMFESYMAERLRRRWVRLRLYRFPGSVFTDYRMLKNYAKTLKGTIV